MTPTATLTLDTHFNAGPIDPRVYGGFLEHLGRAIYGGVYDPGNPRSDANGFRVDVLDALRKLAMPVVRYPGGNYVSGADWRDGVGPKADRPRRPDYAWQSIESNQFGTDEFVAWARAAGAAPYLAVNLGTGTPRDAGDLVEYCNLAGGTHWSDRRRANGHPAPHAVKLWALGNEMDGPWQAGHVPAEVYARRAHQASSLMKGLDPGIQTVVAGSSGNGMPTYMDWDRKVLDACWPTIDYVSAHHYAENYRNDTAWFLGYGVEIDRVLTDYAAVIRFVGAEKKSTKPVYVCFDEWNVWYRARDARHTQGGWAEAPPLLEEAYNLEDALVVAQYLAAFVRRADLVKVACLAQVVNVIAPIVTRPDGLLLQSTYYPFLAFSRRARGVSLTPAVACPTYRAGDRGDVPAVDAAASYDPRSGDVQVFLVNRNADATVTIDVRLNDRTVLTASDGAEMTGHPKAANTWDRPHAVAFEDNHPAVAGGVARVTVPAPGFVVARLGTAAR